MMWESEATALENRVEDLELRLTKILAIARGCHDYGGGYRDDDHGAKAFHHGIDTVINALTAAAAGDTSLQLKVLEQVGAQPSAGISGDLQFIKDELDRLRSIRDQVNDVLVVNCDELEQLQVQLAGCTTAAAGWDSEPAVKGDYGWSPAYQDVLDLRRKFEKISQEHGALKSKCKRMFGDLVW